MRRRLEITKGKVKVQAAVKNCILSLIILDAMVCSLIRNVSYSVAIVLLLSPTLLLGLFNLESIAQPQHRESRESRSLVARPGELQAEGLEHTLPKEFLEPQD